MKYNIKLGFDDIIHTDTDRWSEGVQMHIWTLLLPCI